MGAEAPEPLAGFGAEVRGAAEGRRHDWLVVTGAGDALAPWSEEPVESDEADPLLAVVVSEPVLLEAEESLPVELLWSKALAREADEPELFEPWDAVDRCAGWLLVVDELFAGAALAALDEPDDVDAAAAVAFGAARRSAAALSDGSWPEASWAKIVTQAARYRATAKAMARRRMRRARCRRVRAWARASWRACSGEGRGAGPGGAPDGTPCAGVGWGGEMEAMLRKARRPK